MNILVLAAALSEATLLRMGPANFEPKIDGEITLQEQLGASAHYGAISESTRLMTIRYSCWFFAACKDGFYFASRTSAPTRPQQFTDEDTVALTLQPPNCDVPVTVTIRVKDGHTNLEGVKCAVRRPLGIDICGVEVAETELFIPYGVGGLVKPGMGKWGLQMSVNYSSERETGWWHLPTKPGELGVYEPDGDCPIPSFLTFCTFELWRPRGGYYMQFRINNHGVNRRVEIDAKDSAIIRGIGLPKLDDKEEDTKDVVKNPLGEFAGMKVAAGETRDIIHPEYSLWPGSVNDMRLDLKADKRTFYRRRICWDLAHGQKWLDSEKLPTLDFGFFPTAGNRILIKYSPNGATKLVKGAIRVVNAEGKEFYRHELKGAPYLKEEEIDDRLPPDLPLGDYRAQFAAVNEAGRQYADERTFSVRKFPWQGNTIGKERIIMPPFTPIEVKGDDISFLQTGYHCSGILWDQVKAQGAELFAAPITLKLNGQDFRVSASRFIEQSPDRVVRELDAVAEADASLKLKVTQDYDYDGLCMVKLEFAPGQAVEVRSLQLCMPLKNELANYFDICNRIDQRAYAAPDFTLPKGVGEVWSSATNAPSWNLKLVGVYSQPYIWWGDVAKGFCYFMQSLQRRSLAEKCAAERIVRKNGAATLEVDLVNRPTTWNGPIAYSIGFQPSPVKPQNLELRRFCNDTYSGYICPSNAIRSALPMDFGASPLLYPILSFPNNDKSLFEWTMNRKERDWDGFDRETTAYLARNAKWFAEESRIPAELFKREKIISRQMTGAQHRFYYFDPLMNSCFWPEGEMYKAEWNAMPTGRDNFMSEYGSRIGPARIDQQIYDVKRALDLGYDGIYYDCFGCHRTYNYGINPNAYRDEKGVMRMSACDILEQREIVKRTAMACHLYGKPAFGRPYVDIHTTDCMIVPVMSFAAVATVCERGALGGEYQDRYPESYALMEVCGRPAGVIPRMIGSARVGEKERRRREMLTYMSFMCAYGVFSMYDQGVFYVPEVDKALNAIYDYGWGKREVKMICFYDDDPKPVTHDAKDVRMTIAWKRGESALLMFGNLGEATTVSFDCCGLGLGEVVATDVITGEPVVGNSFKLGRHDFKLVSIRRRDLTKVAAKGAECAGGDLRDRCWMFGHDPGQHDYKDNPFHIPLSPKVTIGDACRDMGISNVCVCVWHLPNDEYLKQFEGLSRVVWCVDNGYLKNNDRKYDHEKLFSAALARLDKLPNLMGFEYDDFFNGHMKRQATEDRLSDGTAVRVIPGARTIGELAAERARVRMGPRPVEMRLVLYTEEVLAHGELLKPIVDQFDVVTLWTWNGSNLARVRDAVARYRATYGDKPTCLGLYMWDFGGKKPIGTAAMRMQLDLGLELYRAGKIDGFVFHCTPLVNKNLPEVNMVREWIATHGHEMKGDSFSD